MEIEASSEIQVLNHTGLSDTTILESREMVSLQRQLTGWVEQARQRSHGSNLWNRGAFTPPDNPYAEMMAARRAVKFDDIVSGVAEVTEGFAFAGVKWESENPDESDVFNQINADLNLDSLVRKMWREEFTYSLCYVATTWGWQDYTVRGRAPAPEVGLEKVTDPNTGAVSFQVPRDPKTNLPVKRGKGPRRKKKYRVWCPTSMRILDAAKIVPLGIGPLGDERYAWQATPGEIGAYRSTIDGTKIDVGMATFFSGQYQPGYEEAAALSQLGVDTKNLLLINPDYVFCHTLTKPDYERFPDIRLKSCFALLDLKTQLVAADRAMLVGAANYILLVRKGDKDLPASQPEIDHLKANYQFVAKLPVIISDHRLDIDIIAPKVDLTLNEEKYDVIDTRLLARLLGTLSLGSRGQRNETNITLSFPVARAMDNRRHMLRRTLERAIGKAIFNHPLNAGTFEEEPNLVYSPRQISLGLEQPLLQALLSLRTQKEISRETILEYFGLDQATEAMRREIEEEQFDAVFGTQIPFSSPAMGQAPNGGPVAPGVAGGEGGRPPGGGEPSANPTKAKPKTPKGNSSTGKDLT